MQKTQPIPHDLHVVTMISNPRRYKKRYDLYRAFKKHMEDSGVQLTTVEIYYGERPPEIHDENTIVLQTNSELWHKENALNIAVSRLPADWKYLAWIDADIQFVRPDWAEETLHMLQHHPVVQPWSVAVDMLPNYEPTDRLARSFAWCHQNTISPYPKLSDDEVQVIKDASVNGTKSNYKECNIKKNLPIAKEILWHSGYAWACTREAFDALGGLIDFAILGSADRYMACALIGQAASVIPKNFPAHYKEEVMIWQERAEKYIQRDLGYVEGTINHFWHGKKVNRQYVARWKIISDNKFDPRYDLKKDYQGLYQLTDRSAKLRDDLRHYFQQRNEDGIDP